MMKTPEPFRREPGTNTTPQLCPDPAVTPCGNRCFGAKTKRTPPRPDQFGTFSSSDLGFAAPPPCLSSEIRAIREIRGKKNRPIRGSKAPFHCTRLR